MTQPCYHLSPIALSYSPTGPIVISLTAIPLDWVRRNSGTSGLWYYYDVTALAGNGSNTWSHQ